MTYAAIIKNKLLVDKITEFFCICNTFCKVFAVYPSKKSGVPPLPCRFQTLLHYATQHHNSVALRPKGQEESC